MKKIFLIIFLLSLFSFNGCFNPNEPTKEKAYHKLPVVTEILLTDNRGDLNGFFYAIGYPGSTHLSNFADHACFPFPNPIKDSFKLRIHYFFVEGKINFYMSKAVFVLDKENKLVDYLSIGNLNIYAPFNNSIIYLKNDYLEGGLSFLEFNAKQLNLTPGFYRIYMETKRSLSWIDILYDPDDVIFKRLIKLPHTILSTVY